MVEPSTTSSNINFKPVHSLVTLLRGHTTNTPPDETAWQAVLDAAAHHMVRPYLLQQIHQMKVQVPPAFLEALQQVVRQITLRILLNQYQLQQVTSLLKNNNIDAVPYKGVIWAQDLYGAADMRESSDIDLMIKEKDIEIIRRVFLDHGYKEHFQADETQRKKLIQIQPEYNYEYYNEHGTGHLIEPHHRTNHRYTGINIPYSVLSPRIIWQNNIYVYDQEATCLLIVLNNGINEGWSTLKYVFDLHKFLEKYNDKTDWNWVVSQLKKYNILNSFLCGLKICEILFNSIIPEYFKEQLKDKKIISLAQNRLNALMYSERSFSSQFNRWLYNVNSKDRLSIKLKVLFFQFIYPTHEDYSFILLPARWFWAYPFVRFYRIVNKYLLTSLRTVTK